MIKDLQMQIWFLNIVRPLDQVYNYQLRDYIDGPRYNLALKGPLTKEKIMNNIVSIKWTPENKSVEGQLPPIDQVNFMAKHTPLYIMRDSGAYEQLSKDQGQQLLELILVNFWAVLVGAMASLKILTLIKQLVRLSKRLLLNPIEKMLSQKRYLRWWGLQ